VAERPVALPPEKRVLGVAFEQVCIGLRTGDCDDDVKQAIANKIIAVAKAGERNPDILCEKVFNDIRRPQTEVEPVIVRLAPVGGTVVSKLTAEGVARFSFLTGPTPQSSSGCIIPYEKGRSFQ